MEASERYSVFTGRCCGHEMSQEAVKQHKKPSVSQRRVKQKRMKKNIITVLYVTSS